ncbi:MAG: hypothetical protein PVJ27_01485 [Candidatus Brocadiaceae bacterium]|jgi:hypothetical protein
MSLRARRTGLILALLAFLPAILYGSRWRTFRVYTEQRIGEEIFPIENEPVRELNLNIATTFGAATRTEDGRLWGIPYQWVNPVKEPCPT